MSNFILAIADFTDKHSAWMDIWWVDLLLALITCSVLCCAIELAALDGENKFGKSE